MNKKKIYYYLYLVALFFFIFSLNARSFNLPSEVSVILLMIGVIILLINLAFFKFW
jgi:NAD/NADP transhydrogenase beta subunit